MLIRPPNDSTAVMGNAPLAVAQPGGAQLGGAHDPFESLVNADKLALLYRQSAHSVFASLVAAGIWVAILWPVASRAAMIAWIVAMMVAAGVRLGLFFGYRHQQQSRDRLAATGSGPDAAVSWPQTPVEQPRGGSGWHLAYTLSLFLSASVWGAAAFVTPNEPLLYLCITYLFVIGLAGAALPAYGVYTHLAIGTMLLLLLPMFGVLMFQTQPLTLLLALAGVSFFLSSVRTLLIHNATVSRSFRLAHELRAASLAAARLADTDSLTGLANRRAFRQAATALLDLGSRERRPATMMVIDIDDFKRINDEYGHLAGDAALCHLAQLLSTELRASDLCARVGGDEFAVLLPNTTVVTASEVAEKLTAALAARQVNTRARPHTKVIAHAQAGVDADHGGVIEMTLSIGLAEGVGGSSVERLQHRADAAMYEAKRHGKGQVRVAPPLPPTGRGIDVSANDCVAND